MAEAFGNQPNRVIQSATGRAQHTEPEAHRVSRQAAVTFSKERNLERQAVVDERELLRDALRRSMGEATLGEVRSEFENRVNAGEFIGVATRTSAPDRAFTTQEMIDYERDTIQAMRDGQNRHEPLASDDARRQVGHNHPHLSESQRKAMEQILSTRDQVTALEGVAGGGKTTSLTAVREIAEQEGYRVMGFAPTSRAAHKLAESGIESSTLQRHLASNEPHDCQKRLYVLDESSLASTKQMNQFLRGLRQHDRVLLVGDVRQHQAVEAGAPYQQLQEAGIQLARLDEIVRQRDSALKEAVEHLSQGHVREAMEKLDNQGRVHEIADRNERFKQIANEYAKQPEGTLIVSPDNRSRTEINQVIHAERQARGQVDHRDERLKVLVARQEITGADRQWAEQYQPGDIVRYTKGSKTHGIKGGEYARVEKIDAKENLVSVKKQTGRQVTYDPRRLQGVTLYRDADRAFSRGDRVQFTAPYREQHIANRELGTIERIDAKGNIRLRLDSGRSLAFNIKENPHLDYGYAVTSHSSQGQTADRVLINVDTDLAGEKLVNRRLAYVAVSRGRYDAQIYTNDKAQLAGRLGRDVSSRTATQPHRESPGPAKRESPELELERERQRTRTQSYDIGR